MSSFNPPIDIWWSVFVPLRQCHEDGKSSNYGNPIYFNGGLATAEFMAWVSKTCWFMRMHLFTLNCFCNPKTNNTQNWILLYFLLWDHIKCEFDTHSKSFTFLLMPLVPEHQESQRWLSKLVRSVTFITEDVYGMGFPLHGKVCFQSSVVVSLSPASSPHGDVWALPTKGSRRCAPLGLVTQPS